MKASFVTVNTDGINSDPVTRGKSNDYAATVVVPMISLFEMLVFGAAAVLGGFTFVANANAGVTPHSYGLVLATLQAAVLAVTHFFLKSNQKDKNNSAFVPVDELKDDLIRVLGVFVAGIFGILQLYSMCVDVGFLGEKGVTILVSVVGLTSLVAFKLLFNDGEAVEGNESLGWMWWILALLYVAAYILVYVDLLVAANGCPISSNVVYTASMSLGYLVYSIAFAVVGGMIGGKFDKYAPSIKALVFVALDLLVFGFLCFCTPLASLGAPFRGTVMFLPAVVP